MQRVTRRQVVEGMGAVGLALAAGCGLPPFEARRTEKIRRIGFFTGDSLESSAARVTAPFRQGLIDLGWEEGKSLAIEWRYGNGSDEVLAAPMAELSQLPVDVIVVSAPSLARMARDVTVAIPIVVTGGGSSNLLDSGLIATLARPGGTITGLTNMPPKVLNGKRLELLKDTVPAASRVAALAEPATESTNREQLASDAQSLDLQLQIVEARAADEMGPAFAAMVQEGAEALFVFLGPLLGEQYRRIPELAAEHRLPAIYGGRASVDVGGLMAYGPTTADLSRRAATYVDKILKGANPAELPVEQPTRFDFVINLKTAHALGLTIPPSVLLQATDVVQ